MASRQQPVRGSHRLGHEQARQILGQYLGRLADRLLLCVHLAQAGGIAYARRVAFEHAEGRRRASTVTES